MKFSLARFLTFVFVGLVTIFASTRVYAQAPDFLWAQQGGGDNHDVARGVTADNVGNAIVAGNINGKAYLGDREIISAGYQDIFVAKYSDQGEVRWIKQLGAEGRDVAIDVDVDKRGNSVITGFFSNSVNFDKFRLKSVGSGDMFTAKLDPSGKILWAEQAGGPNLDEGNEIATDSSDNELIIANTYGTVTVGDVVLNHQGGIDTFIVKYDPDGKFLWARQMAGSENEQGRGISPDKQANVLSIGEFNGTITIGSQTLTSSSNLRDIFLAKYDASGNFLWTKRFGSAGEDYGRGIGADAAGNIYFSGVFSGSVKFGSKTLNSIGGSRDIFLAKADASGNILWVRQMGGSGPDEGCEIEVDDKGNAYISGEFPGSAIFDSTVLKSAGWRDVFTAKFDSQGKLIWIKQSGGTEDDVNYAIALDAADNVTIVGTFKSNATFGDFVLKDVGNKVDFFVAQLGLGKKRS